MRLAPGTRVGPYEVVATLGTGGMAEVYRARDSRLQREVALKVVGEALSGDGAFLARLEHEARLAGSLNHPNIVAVHDVGSHEGAPFVVTELLQGETLRERLSRGQPPLSSALDWGVQIAQGLAAAHEHGIIHRDLKPENVFLTRSGHLKLLDFGIAKAAMPASSSHDLLEPTLSPAGAMTRTGAVMGTPGYMSPEQVRGEALDARSDIFSFGSILYELLSGRRAFPGGSVVESGHAVLHDDLGTLPEGVPPAVAQIVRRCLEKDPEQRFRSARDVGFALEAVRGSSGAFPALGGEAARRQRRQRLAVLAVVAAGVLAVAFALFANGHRRTAPQRLPEVEPVTFRWGAISGGRFLPDGRVAFSAAFEGAPEELFVRPAGSPTAQELGLRDIRLLAASGAGELAVLLRPRVAAHWKARQGTLATVPSVGGTPREIAEDAEDAAWSPTGALAIVRQVGATRVLESPPDHQLFRTRGWISNPRFSGAGDQIAFLHHPDPTDDMGEIVLTDLQGRARTLSQRWATAFGLAWSPDDREIWFTAGRYRTNVLTAVSTAGVARDLYATVGEIQLEDVSKLGDVLLDNMISRNELVYAGDSSRNPVLLSWTDYNYTAVALSADGRVLFSSLQTLPTSQGLQPSWVMLRRTDGAPAQILGEGVPLDLSPDARWALVSSSPARDAFRKLTALPTGAGTARSVPTHDLEINAARWMPDGNDVLVSGRVPGDEHHRLYRLSRTGSPPTPISDLPLGALRFLQVSPDGRWVATLDENQKLVLISLQDGSMRLVPHPGLDGASPRGWSAEGGLWVSDGVTPVGPRMRLVRLDPLTGKSLEERIVGPPDPGGASLFRDVVLSPDGRQIAFTYVRELRSLVIVRGLGSAAQ